MAEQVKHFKAGYTNCVQTSGWLISFEFQSRYQKDSVLVQQSTEDGYHISNTDISFMRKRFTLRIHVAKRTIMTQEENLSLI